MKKKIPIKLSDIDKNLELWRGTKIRLMNDGTNLYPEVEYYDYMLVQVPGDNDYMILVNITIDDYKEGAVFRKKAAIDHSLNKAVVKKAALREALGPDFKNCYLISWDE